MNRKRESNRIKKSYLTKSRNDGVRRTFSIINPASSFQFMERSIGRNTNQNFEKIKKIFDEGSHHKGLARVSERVISRVENLVKKFPNFSEVIDSISNHLVLQKLGNKTFHVEPIYIWGEPGIGKTEFILCLSEIFDVELVKSNASQFNGSLSLSGTEPQWSDSAPGLIVQSMLRSEKANFIFFIDELEKANESHSGGNPLNALYDLLEEKSAKRFVDQAITNAVLFDASAINFIAAGNDTKGVHPALLSRFNVFEVPAPTLEQRRAIVIGVHRALLKENVWGQHFDMELTSDVIDALTEDEESIRHIKKSLKMAYANAIRQERSKLVVGDIEKQNFHKVPMGFY